MSTDADDAIRRGDMVVVVDDPDHEDEGDAVTAAQRATPAAADHGVRRLSAAEIPTPFGPFRAVSYACSAGSEHVALVRGEPAAGLADVRLLTDNPAKTDGLRAAGVQARAVSLRTLPTPRSVHHLRAKRDVLGHDLAGDPPPATVG
jgi:hypothetical protein